MARISVHELKAMKRRGEKTEPANPGLVGAFAARAVERAVLRAISEATSLAGIPSARDWLAAPSGRR